MDRDGWDRLVAMMKEATDVVKLEWHFGNNQLLVETELGTVVPLHGDNRNTEIEKAH